MSQPGGSNAGQFWSIKMKFGYAEQYRDAVVKMRSALTETLEAIPISILKNFGKMKRRI